MELFTLQCVADSFSQMNSEPVTSGGGQVIFASDKICVKISILKILLPLSLASRVKLTNG